ncbi:hypothetical protein [Alloyangia pacifica]|nr:hypothetical protein [Alloyangia pacifica]
MSAQTARATLARGLALRAINEASVVRRIVPAYTHRTGASLKALSRIVGRLRRSDGVVQAKVIGTRKAPYVMCLWRQADRTNVVTISDTGREYVVDTLFYFLSCRDQFGECTREDGVFFQRHAVQRWIERGGAGDPRINLLGKLDEEAYRLLADREVLDAHANARGCPDPDRHTFGIPHPEGLWIVSTSGAPRRGDSGTIPALTARTFLGWQELDDDQTAYRQLALDQGICAAEARWPLMFDAHLGED